MAAKTAKASTKGKRSFLVTYDQYPHVLCHKLGHVTSTGGHEIEGTGYYFSNPILLTSRAKGDRIRELIRAEEIRMSVLIKAQKEQGLIDLKNRIRAETGVEIP